jgi:hypothetical protein
MASGPTQWAQSSRWRASVARGYLPRIGHPEQGLSNLVFTTGGFSSGSTLLFTLMRKTGEYHCLYEPLHERLREHLHAGLKVYEHHYHVDNYFAEYRGFTDIDRIFDPRFGNSRLALAATDEYPELYRYLTYLIGSGFSRQPKVLLKFNRASFRLPWLRAAFPKAKVVHIYRDCESQWNSTVKRTQVYLGQKDVGQDSVAFNGMNIATWCDDLAATFPELEASRSQSGFERFSKLWALSLRESTKHADVTVRFEDLTQDYDAVCGRIWDTIGCTADYHPLKRWVVRSEQRAPLTERSNSFMARLGRLGIRLRFEWAKFRVQMKSRQPGAK